MDSFYESILNIKKYDEKLVLKEIKNIINEELSDVLEYVDSLEGLCKILSNNIKCRLDELGIKNKIININKYNKPDHEFIILNFKNKDSKIIYVLIDSTYRQFLDNNEKIINYKNFPANILKEKNPELLNNILNFGCSVIDEKSIKDYMNSFEIETDLQDIMLGSDIDETNIKNNKKR